MEVIPTVESGVMAIIEQYPDGVVSHRLETRDLYVAFATDDLFLVCGVALHFGAWRLHAQIFCRQNKTCAGLKGECQSPFRLVEPQFRRPRPRVPPRSSSLSSRASPASMMGTPL